MATRRYLFVLDSSRPLQWVDRYLANASLRQRTSGLALAYMRGPEAMAATSTANATIRERIREQAALTARLATLDLFAPTQWAVESASAIEEHPENVSARLRAFFAAPHTNTDQLVLCADREGAAESLAAARALTLAQIGALEPATQAAAVRAMWANFARYFERLGIRVDGWAKYRNAWASATECDSGQDSLSGFLQSAYAGRFPEGYDLLFQSRPTGGPASAASVARAVELLATPPAPPWSAEVIAQVYAESGATLTPSSDSAVARGLARGAAMNAAYRAAEAVSAPAVPSWRAMARARFAATYGSVPDQLFFGSPVEVSAAGHDVFRLWITEEGRLVTTEPDLAQYSRWDCVLREGAAALPAPQSGFNWMCGAISRDAQGRGYYLAPLLWYAQLLQPLLAYLATRDPLEVAYEVELDVLGKNLWTSIATGRGEATMAGLAASRSLVSASDAQARFASNQQSFQNGVRIATIGATLINPIFGAAVGLGGTLLGFFAAATEAPPPRPASDCFFRFEPVVEFLQIREGGIRAWQCSETDPPTPVTVQYHGGDAPPSAPRVQGFASLSPTLATTQNFGVLALTPQRLRIAGLPGYAATCIDGQRTDDTLGWWEGGAWVIPGVAPGVRRLRAVPQTQGGVQTGPARSVTVTVPASGGLTVEWSAMPIEQPSAVAPTPAAPPPAALILPTPPSRAPLVFVGLLAVAGLAVAGFMSLRPHEKPRPKRNGRRRSQLRGSNSR